MLHPIHQSKHRSGPASQLLAVHQERDDTQRGGLPDGLGQHAGEHEVQQVEARGPAETCLKAGAEDPDEDERKREVRDDARAITEQLDEVAVRQRQDRGHLTHWLFPRSRDTRPRGSACASARA